MASQKLVRCEIRKDGSEGEPSVRYVPLEIYGLWEYLMRTRHNFEVVRQVASLWIDVDESPEAAYGENQYERVTEVTLLRYSERDGMFTRVSRYFDTEECSKLTGLLLSHYASVNEPGSPAPQVKEKHGIWIRREPRA
ncbi:MAG TPA: hypothetical protein VID50_07750 [Candidatus Eisenbacteria bacterium]|jgi:hypothetical protein